MPVPKGKHPQKRSSTSFKEGHAQQDLTGHSYGRLTVLGFSGRYRRVSKWLCLCTCGNTKEIRQDALKSGATISCGCFQKEAASRANSLGSGVAARNEEYYIYKRAAKSRGLDFELTKADFINLIKSPCYYCGIEPSRRITYRSGTELINGIDRAINTLGYTLENSLPCCKRCNTMKMDMDIHEFLEKISCIYRRLYNAR